MNWAGTLSIRDVCPADDGKAGLAQVTIIYLALVIPIYS